MQMLIALEKSQIGYCFFTKSDDYKFNKLFAPYSDAYIESKFTHYDQDGRRFRLSDLNPPGGRGPEYEFHNISSPWRFTEEKMRK